jgi:hypothetical protein
MATQHDHPDFNLMIDLIPLQNDNTTYILLALFHKEPNLNNLIEPWSSYLLGVMHSKITAFVKQWNIDLSTVNLWDIEPSKRTIVQVSNQTSIVQEPVKKPF